MKLDRIVRHSGVYLVATGLQRGMPLLLLPIAATFLDTGDIGAIGVGAVLAGGVALLSTFGFNIAIIRHVPQASAGLDDADCSHARWSSIFFAQLVWAAVVAIAGLLVVRILGATLSNLDWHEVIVPAILLGVAGSVLQMALSAYRGREYPAGYLAIAAGVFALSVPLAVGGAARFGTDGYLYGLAVASAIPGLVGIGLSASKPSFDREFTVGTVGLAAPFMVHWLATWVLAGFDRFLIEGSIGLDAAGVFYVAFVYASVPLLIAEAFGTAWLPAFINRPSEASAVVRRTTLVVSLIIGGMVLVGIALAVPIMPMLYPDIGYDSVVLIAILAPIAIIRVPHIVATAMLVNEGRTPLLGLSSGVAAAANVTVVFLVIETLGLTGSAWAKTLAYALASVWVWGAAVRLPDRLVGGGIVVIGIVVAAVAAFLVDWADGSTYGVVAPLVLSAVGVALAVTGYIEYKGVIADDAAEHRPR